MSALTLSVVVGKNGRVYECRFDHDEARRRHANGEFVADLAREYGVSWAAVGRVVDEKTRRRMDAASRAYQTSSCEVCRGVTRHNPSQTSPDGRLLCNVCRGKERRTRFETTPGGTVVAAVCFTCKRMLDLDDFCGGVKYRDIRPEGIHNSCRACLTVLRREYRNKRKVPCSHGCGTLVLHERRDPSKPPQCVACARRSCGSAPVGRL